MFQNTNVTFVSVCNVYVQNTPARLVIFMLVCNFFTINEIGDTFLVSVKEISLLFV